MKPGIIERLDALDASLEAKIKRIIQESTAEGTGGDTSGSSLLVGTIIPFSGDMEGGHPINPLTRKLDKAYGLCDGTSYFSPTLGVMLETPDLRDRFVLGSGGRFLAGESGGSLESKHTVQVLPTTLTAAQIPPHTHHIGLRQPASMGGAYHIARTLCTDYVGLSTPTNAAGGGQAHTHGGTVTFTGMDKYTPFLALCYLMKI